MLGTSTKAILPASRTVVARLTASSMPRQTRCREPCHHRSESSRSMPQLTRTATTPNVVIRKNHAISVGPLAARTCPEFERPAQLNARDGDMHQGQNHEVVLQQCPQKTPAVIQASSRTGHDHGRRSALRAKRGELATAMISEMYSRALHISCQETNPKLGPLSKIRTFHVTSSRTRRQATIRQITASRQITANRQPHRSSDVKTILPLELLQSHAPGPKAQI